jgi:hypothetical protein
MTPAEGMQKYKTGKTGRIGKAGTIGSIGATRGNLPTPTLRRISRASEGGLPITDHRLPFTVLRTFDAQHAESHSNI